MQTREMGDAKAAKRVLGSPLLLREHARDAWGWRWVDDMLWDMRHALRMFRQNPGFTTVALLTLAFGIAANATVFTVVNAMLFRGFPHIDPDNRIRYIATRSEAGMQTGVSYPDFEDWRSETESFDDVAVVGNAGLRLLVADENDFPATYDGTQLSANAFSVLRQTPILGRDFKPADAAVGAAPVAILSYGLWERRYSKDPDIVSRVVRIADTPTTVIGVMGKAVAFPQRVDLWVSLKRTADLEPRQSRRLIIAF